MYEVQNWFDLKADGLFLFDSVLNKKVLLFYAVCKMYCFFCNFFYTYVLLHHIRTVLSNYCNPTCFVLATNLCGKRQTYARRVWCSKTDGRVSVNTNSISTMSLFKKFCDFVYSHELCLYKHTNLPLKQNLHNINPPTEQDLSITNFLLNRSTN